MDPVNNEAIKHLRAVCKLLEHYTTILHDEKQALVTRNLAQIEHNHDLKSRLLPEIDHLSSQILVDNEVMQMLPENEVGEAYYLYKAKVESLCRSIQLMQQENFKMVQVIQSFNELYFDQLKSLRKNAVTYKRRTEKAGTESENILFNRTF